MLTLFLFFILFLFILLSFLNLLTAIAFFLPEKKYKAFFPKVSIVVRCWNDGKVVERLIQNLLKQKYPKSKYEIIIADDGSRDETEKICKKYEKLGKIKYFRMKKHIEKKAIVTDAAIKKHSTGEIVLECDTDSVVPENWVAEMVKPFSDENVMGVSGNVMCGNWYENILTKVRAIENFWFFCTSFYGRFRISGQGFLYGSNKAFRKSFWKSIGGHPKKTLVEDAELSAKIISLGYRIVNIKSVSNLQEEVKTTKQYLSERRRWLNGDFEVGKYYSKELRTNKIQYLFMLSNFSWDGIILLSWILIIWNPFFVVPILVNLLALWMGFVALKVKKRFYLYSFSYLLVGPILQAAAVASILKTKIQKNRIRWTKVWHSPVELKCPTN